VNINERRARIRLGRLANRCGWRITRPKPEDAVDLGAYRLVELTTNRVLLGEQFDASLDEIEAYLRRQGPPHKTPLEIQENRVRQLAAKRNFVLRKTRPRLYVKTAGEYKLYRTSDLSTPVLMSPDRSPSLEELKAFLHTQPVDPTKGFYSPRPTRAERMHHASTEGDRDTVAPSQS
jgi:hypothetical protein